MNSESNRTRLDERTKPIKQPAAPIDNRDGSFLHFRSKKEIETEENTHPTILSLNGSDDSGVASLSIIGRNSKHNQEDCMIDCTKFLDRYDQQTRQEVEKLGGNLLGVLDGVSQCLSGSLASSIAADFIARNYYDAMYEAVNSEDYKIDDYDAQDWRDSQIRTAIRNADIELTSESRRIHAAIHAFVNDQGSSSLYSIPNLETTIDLEALTSELMLKQKINKVDQIDWTQSFLQTTGVFAIGNQVYKVGDSNIFTFTTDPEVGRVEVREVMNNSTPNFIGSGGAQITSETIPTGNLLAILLCSDGLSGYLNWGNGYNMEEYAKFYEDSGGDPVLLLQSLVEDANRWAHDNVTGIVIDVGAIDPTKKRSPQSRLVNDGEQSQLSMGATSMKSDPVGLPASTRNFFRRLLHGDPAARKPTDSEPPEPQFVDPRSEIDLKFNRQERLDRIIKSSSYSALGRMVEEEPYWYIVDSQHDIYQGEAFVVVKRDEEYSAYLVQVKKIKNGKIKFQIVHDGYSQIEEYEVPFDDFNKTYDLIATSGVKNPFKRLVNYNKLLGKS